MVTVNNSKKTDSIRISGKVGYQVINDLIEYRKEKKSDQLGENYQVGLSGAATYLGDKNFVLNRMGNRAYDIDSPEAVRKLSTTESVTGQIDQTSPEKVDRKKYLEEILMINTDEAEEWFSTRFRRDGALRNFGKLMSDHFKEALSWKRSLDMRTAPLSPSGGRYRARQRFAGYYNTGVKWGDFTEYKDGNWFTAATDLILMKEMKGLYEAGYSTGAEPGYTNYHFNMGLGFGESQVFNPPFQYNDLDDPRTHPRYTKIGRVWVKQVLNHMPIMMVMPGKIKYHMNTFTMMGIDFGAAASNADYLRSDNWFKKIIAAAWMGVTDIVGSAIAFATSIFTGGKLITFRQQINLFQKYFDQVAMSLATNMGLTTPTGMYTGRWKILSLTHIQPGIGIRRSSAGGKIRHQFGKGYRSNQMIAFMMTKSISCSETISNSTRENPLQEQLNAASSEEQQNEQTGQNTGNLFKDILNSVISGDPSHATSAVMDVGGKLARKVGGMVSQMALIKSGAARIMLPEVWESSSFSRSYSFTFDCFAPYGNPLCKFETWGIQLCFWLTMALPRQVGSYSYIEPFVGRYVMPGKFNINYGIVDSLSIDRGDDINDWNNSDNLPRTVKLSVSVKDFQPSLMLPRASRSLLRMGYESLFPPSGFAEYMATVAGLSLSDQMDWKKRLGRSFSQWTAGWRRRLNQDIIMKSIFNIPIIDRIGGIFAPYDNVYDRVEVYEDRATLQEFADQGVNAMRSGAVRAQSGTMTGTILPGNIILREIYSTIYMGNPKGSQAAGLMKAFGKIVKPKEVENVGWDVEGIVNKTSEAKETDEKNLFENMNNLDSLKEETEKK